MLLGVFNVLRSYISKLSAAHYGLHLYSSLLPAHSFKIFPYPVSQHVFWFHNIPVA
jgi:hypothetical protein